MAPSASLANGHCASLVDDSQGGRRTVSKPNADAKRSLAFSSNRVEENVDQLYASEMEAAVEILLRAIGENPSREGLVKTPSRVSSAFHSAMQGYRESPQEILRSALFSEEGAFDCSGQGGGSGGAVIVRDIECFSTCRGCLLPFRIVCHVAYIPHGNRVVGISKLPRAALSVARRLQSPHSFAEELCEVVASAFEPGGVAVIAEAMHLVDLENSVTSTVSSATGAAMHAMEDGEEDLDHRNGICKHRRQAASSHAHTCSEYLGNGCSQREAEAPGVKQGTESRGWAKQHSPGWSAVLAVRGCLEDKHSLEEVLLLLNLRREMMTTLKSSLDRSSEDKSGISGKLCISAACPLITSHDHSSSATATLQNGESPSQRSFFQSCQAARILMRGGVTSEEQVEEAAEALLRILTRIPGRHTASEQAAERYTAYLMAATEGYRATTADVLRAPAQSECYHSKKSFAPQVLPSRSTSVGRVIYHQGPVSSLCEHHLLPFFGRVHIWYTSNSTKPSETKAQTSSLPNGAFTLPQEETPGLPQLSAAAVEGIVLMFSRRLQVQERLTKEIAELVAQVTGAGVMVVAEAWHMCMSVRGVERPGASTTSLSSVGCFTDSASLRALCLKTMQQ